MSTSSTATAARASSALQSSTSTCRRSDHPILIFEDCLHGTLIATHNAAISAAYVRQSLLAWFRSSRQASKT